MTASLQSPSCIRTRAASTATSSQSTSPSSQNSQSETPFAPAKLAAANRSLLVRVLNRNLVQQREEATMQSLGSDPLLTSLPAGKFHQVTPTVLEDILAAQAFCEDTTACSFPSHATHVAGSPLSYPNTATARMVADHIWSPLESQLTSINSPDVRSPTTPAAALLSSCDSPTSVLLHSTGTLPFCLTSVVLP